MKKEFCPFYIKSNNPFLTEAIIKNLKWIGYTVDTKGAPMEKIKVIASVTRTVFVMNSGKELAKKLMSFNYDIAPSGGDVIFKLPAQYDEALEFAKEQFEIISGKTNLTKKERDFLRMGYKVANRLESAYEAIQEISTAGKELFESLSDEEKEDFRNNKNIKKMEDRMRAIEKKIFATVI